jgi:tRNA pseudouridine55 synthase
MDKVIQLNKKIGQTPLQCIEEVRSRKLEVSKMKMGYAGRLDPMAEGLLLIMVGEECKNRVKYQKLDKEYEVDILIGISTDSYDLLGIPCIQMTPVDLMRKIKNFDKSKFLELLIRLKGKYMQSYPPFSAGRIKGEMMYKLVRENRLDESMIPKKEVEIKDIELLEVKNITADELSKLIIQRINLIKGDFRQKEILKAWEKYFVSNTISQFPVVIIKVSCSSGTYMRTIANDLGLNLGCGALVLNIKRTRIGKYKLKK